MTDNEIIKALECCTDDSKGITQCAICPYQTKDKDYCVADLLEQSLSLINRQKAEIERLSNHIQEGIDLAKQIPEMVALALAEAIKEFAERLKAKFDPYDADYYCYAFVDDVVKEMGVD